MDSKGYSKWYPVLVMVGIQFVFATINVLLKKVIDEGLNDLVFITYRLTVATIFLAPVAFFFERYVSLLRHFEMPFCINVCDD